MTTDLHELFSDAGRTAPGPALDLDDVVRRGRRLRARRRFATGGALVGVGAAVVASVALVSGLPSTGGAVAPAADAGSGAAATGSPSASLAPPTPTPSTSDVPTAVATDQPPSGMPAPTPSSVSITLDAGSLSAADRAVLDAVVLPDPAPGFPVRRWRDGAATQEGLSGSAAYWTRIFGLAVTPYAESTSSAGQVSQTPTGPEVTLTVGYFPAPKHGAGVGIYPGETFVGDVTAAGHAGWVTTASDKGMPVRNLYVPVGRLTVWVDGMGAVTTAQLVALADALTGLR